MKLSKILLSITPYRYLSLLVSALLISFSTITPVQAAIFTLLKGERDGFDTSNQPEEPMPSSGSLLRLNNTIGKPLVDFDDNTTDGVFLHTFNFPEIAGEIVSAHLEFRARGIGQGSLVNNDSINLFFINSQGEIMSGDRWGRAFGRRNDDPGLINDDNLMQEVWDNQQDVVFSLNLAELPLNPSNPNSSAENIIPMINNLGFLDIQIQDDTEVDYVQLTLKTSVPESSSIFSLLAIVIFGLISNLKFEKR